MLSRAPARTRFWIDEAYVDYVGPDESLERFAARERKHGRLQNAVEGLRPERHAGRLSMRSGTRSLRPIRRITPPWSIGLPSQIAAVRALENPGYYQQKYRDTARLRMDLTARLAKLGVDVVPGSANFLLCHLPASGPDAGTLIRGCQSAGLFLRDVRSMGTGFGTQTFRIAVKAAATNERAVEIMRRQLGISADPRGGRRPRWKRAIRRGANDPHSGPHLR